MHHFWFLVGRLVYSLVAPTHPGCQVEVFIVEQYASDSCPRTDFAHIDPANHWVQPERGRILWASPLGTIATCYCSSSTF